MSGSFWSTHLSGPTGKRPRGCTAFPHFAGYNWNRRIFRPASCLIRSRFRVGG